MQLTALSLKKQNKTKKHKQKHKTNHIYTLLLSASYSHIYLRVYLESHTFLTRANAFCSLPAKFLVLFQPCLIKTAFNLCLNSFFFKQPIIHPGNKIRRTWGVTKLTCSCLETLGKGERREGDRNTVSAEAETGVLL